MIASRSFLFSCDQHIQNPESESQRLPPLPQNHGETVYVHPTAIKHFVEQYLPQLQFRIVLLSGDSDVTVPDDIPEAQTVLNHPLILKWYAQNCVKPGEKLCQLPIGLDFHTLARGPHSWGPQQSPESQMQDITTLKSLNVPKLSKCYSNFHFFTNTRYGQDRKLAISQIPRHLIFYEPRHCPRMKTWKNMLNFKYVISPHGNGLDCHRTWEAIFLGCIPIVRTSALDPLFEGLPVLIVREWSHISQRLLDTFQPDYSQIQKLDLSYWLNTFKLLNV
jgi:hypothetical protein